MACLEMATVFICDFFHEINPEIFPPPRFFPGRQLNPPEDDGVGSAGHLIVSVNQVFEDPQHNHFRVITVLGNGTFSYVFKCQLLSDRSTFVALKVIKNLPQYRTTGISEVMIHQMLSQAADHPGKSHVIQPLSTFEINGHVCIVLPLFHRSLFEGICQTQPVPLLLESIRRIMNQLMQALAFIHSNGVIHCDLKPDNILFKDENTDDIVLIDFGSASTNRSGQGQYIQSRFYRSPEVMLGLQYNSMIDIWSAGCVAAELFLDFAIFACENESDAIHSMVALLGPIPDQLLRVSRHWWKFYDMTPRGFGLKMDPVEVLLTRHSYHGIYQQTGPVPLRQLICEHVPIQNEVEARMVACFSDFVHRLLEFDAMRRLTASQALVHPFLQGEIQFEGWEPPAEPRVNLNPALGHPRFPTPSIDNLPSSDIFALM